MRLRNDINVIQSILPEVIAQADAIRNKLELNDLSIANDSFFLNIEKCLIDLKFDIVFTNKLHTIKGYGHLPSITIFKEQFHKSNGGCIYIYDKYSERKKRELLIHEFIHIYDDFTPTWSTDSTDFINGYMLSNLTLKAVELKTNLISMALMIPVRQLQVNLFNCSYDINEIVKQYKAIKTSSIIRWLTIHDNFNAHFAILHFVEIKKTEILKIDEYSRDKNALDIYNILSNENSIAYNSNVNKISISGDSTIDNRKYQCFCFYEKDVQQPLPISVNPFEIIMPCDEMVVIGWSKDVYNYIKELEFKAIR
jgi:hypothetical protein